MLSFPEKTGLLLEGILTLSKKNLFFSDSDIFRNILDFCRNILIFWQDLCIWLDDAHRKELQRAHEPGPAAEGWRKQ